MSSKPTYDPGTLPALIDYVRGRRQALIIEQELADTYIGPDPSPSKTAANKSAVETLTGVLEAIRDIEANNVKKRLNAALGL